MQVPTTSVERLLRAHPAIHTGARAHVLPTMVGIVGKSQSVLMMISPMISTRTLRTRPATF